MRNFIIDTDTASDDAVALIMALREKDVNIRAITVVAGNVPLNLAVKNALISVEMAGTYAPPVFRGVSGPLLKKLFTSEFVHGDDGMGNMNLRDPLLKEEAEHAVDALIRIVSEAGIGEIELITLGPLTNVALASLKAPDVMRKLKRIVIMGGAGLGSGNITPVAEFNIFVDAEAAQIVVNSGIPLYFIGWDVSMGTTFINREDIDYLRNSGSDSAKFCVRCNESLKDFNYRRLGKTGFDLPDPATVAAAFYEDITDNFEAYCYVDYKSESGYGQLVIDYLKILNKKPNAVFCKKLDGEKFKERLFKLII